jgi:hypothetical protein
MQRAFAPQEMQRIPDAENRFRALRAGVRAAGLAADPKEAEIDVADDQHREANGKAYNAIGEREVDLMMCCTQVDEEAHDGDEGGGEERSHSHSGAHEQGLKPAEVPKRNSQHNTVATGLIDMIRASHLEVEYGNG